MQRKRHRGLCRFVAMLLVFGMLATSLGTGEVALAAGKKKIKSIKLKKPAIQTLALKKGEKYKLKWKCSPGKLKNKVQFTSGKKSVVSVSKKGVLKAKKPGKAVITIKSKTKPVKKVKLKVTVYKKLKKVKKITLDKTSASLTVGDKLTLKASVSPKKATVKKVTYKSSKKSIATVNQKGVVTAKKAGTVKITAYARDGRGAKAVCKITVAPKGKDDTATQTGGSGDATATPTITPAGGGNTTVPRTSTPTPAGGGNTTAPSTSTATPAGGGNTTAPATSTPTPAGGGNTTAPATSTPTPTGGGNTTAPATLAPTPTGGGDATAPATLAPTPTGGDATATPTPAGASNTPTETPSQDMGDTFVFSTESQTASLYVDEEGEDYEGLSLVAKSFAGDIKLLSESEAEPQVLTKVQDLDGSAVIVGSIGNNSVIDSLIEEGTIDVSDIKGKWETYKICVVENPVDKIEKAVIVVGSDKRGTIYGLYHISELLGVSPWVYWGDVAPAKQKEIVLEDEILSVTSKEPSVKYRGIFLNDEAPSLTGWVKANFGNYNVKFYEKVYELILRCKGNYLWPAMWSNIFSEEGNKDLKDASSDITKYANAELADKYGIVMGTSHHEPMCRAGEEWKYSYKNYGTSDAWDFANNKKAITDFWKDGITRNKSYENVYTLGMRGEADSALGGGVKENIDLLKDIITTQKDILKDNNLSDAPQVLTIYKEVQNYWNGANENGTFVEGLKNWDKLDDVTIMLCDDNFGNMQTLPTTKKEINRAGGWGMYYHFDYHGGPTSYEWVNTVELDKVWEQMTMAYEHGIDDIWIVNVGDLKPMELNISYFLDMAYDYDTWGANGLNKTEEYQQKWIKQQFGQALDEEQIEDVASILEEYTWLNGSHKPERLGSGTYDVTNYNEAMEVLGRIERFVQKAEKYKKIIPDELAAAYFELVYYPAVASANVTKMQIYAGLNEFYYEQGSAAANIYASLLEQAIELDQDLQYTYNSDMPGVGTKWKYMMSSPHVGYVTWDSSGWSYPKAKWYKVDNISMMIVSPQNQNQTYSEGSCELNDFTNINQESYTVNISNGGGKAFEYTASASADWIRLSKSEGRVTIQDSLEVSVDWAKVTKDTSGTITLKGADSTVTINVNAKVYDTSKLEKKTYVYANGYASILAGNYTGSGAGGAALDGTLTECKTINGYGKMGQAVKGFPTTYSFAKNASDAPYVEYKVSVPEAGTYKLTAYTAPSNNIESTDVSIRYGLSVNGGETSVINTINSDFAPGEYSGTWTTDVDENGRQTESDITLKEGVNTIRIYAVDPTFVLQKLVVSKESVQTSHFGPGESYYVGKTIGGKTALTEIPLERFAIPGRIDAVYYEGSSETEKKTITVSAGKSYNYPVIISGTGEYLFSVCAKSSNGAVVALMWGDKEIGRVTIGDENYVYSIAEAYSLTEGEGMLTLKGISGSADVEYVSGKMKTSAGGQLAFITATSEQSGYEAASAYDKDVETCWKPKSDDTKPTITFDFEGEYDIDRFALTQVGNGVTGYELQKLNGSDWETVYEGTTIANGKAVFIQGRQPIKGSKFRFVFTGSTIQISEIELTPYINWAYEDKDKIILSGKNSAGDKNVTSDKLTSLVDGDRITKGFETSEWQNSTNANRHTITMEFSQARTIDTVRVISLQESEAAKAGTGTAPDLSMTSDRAQHSYQASYYDGSTWSVIGATVRPSSGNPKLFGEFTLDKAVTATKVRIEIYTSWWVRINEIEAVQTQKCVPAVPNTTKSFAQTGEKKEFEVELSKDILLGRIAATGDYDEDLTFSYYSGDKYTEIDPDRIDIIKTADGWYAIPADDITASQVKVTSKNELAITSISVYEGAEPEKGVTEKQFFSATFETGTDGMGDWGGAVETTKKDAYEGEKCLLVSNRDQDYSATVISIGSLLGTEDTKTEYTLSFYVKNADPAKPLPVAVQICNQAGTDVEDAKVVATAKAGEWTYVEYKFRMESKDHEYLKILTSGDTKDSNGMYSDFYLDNVYITTPLEPCSCKLDRPEITNESDVEMISSKGFATIDLEAEATTTHADCPTSGHKDSVVSYQYYVVDSIADDGSGDSIASLDGNTLKVTGTGKVIVRVRAEVNGYVRYGMMEFTVKEYKSETYMNYAAKENGGSATVPSGGEGSADNLIDGKNYGGNNDRWRINKSTAYVEVYFDGQKEIDQVYFYSQTDDDKITEITDDLISSMAQKDLTFRYLKDGEWVAFENGTITGNTKVKCGVFLKTPVSTPAIRVDVNSSVSSWIRCMEIEAWGDVDTSVNESCQLGVPKLTSANSVELDKTTNEASLQLTAEAIYYNKGCKTSGHSDATPEYSYSIVGTSDIASITKDTITFTKAGTAKVKVTASLNGITKESETYEIIATENSYTNFALAKNGSTIEVSTGENDATNKGKLIDGDITSSNDTRWRTNKFPAHVDIDFGKERTIERLDLFWQFNTPIDYTLDAKDDFGTSDFTFSRWVESESEEGGEWVEFVSVSGNDKAWYQNKLSEPVTTTKIRLEITKHTSNYARLIEIQTWGIEDDDIEVDDPTPGPTPTAASTSSPSPTPTEVSTSSPSPTPTEASTSSPSPTPTEASTSSPSPTPTEVSTPTPSPSPTSTPIPHVNYAAKANGGSVTVPNGGEGSADNLIDGKNYGGNNDRWRINKSTAYVEVYFDGQKEIDQVYFYAQTDDDKITEITDDLISSLAQKDLTFSYLKDGEWVAFENGTITGNTKVKCGVFLKTPVSTPAIRVDVNSSVSSWIRCMEIEAWGDVDTSVNESCQLGVPKLTSANSVELDKTTNEASLQLTAEAIYYNKGCKTSGHSDATPEYSYSIVGTSDIASITEDTITFTKAGTAKVKVTASLNGITKESETYEITATENPYTNFALAKNGSTIEVSKGENDATNKGNLIDGDITSSNDTRWRTNQYPAHVDIDFGQERTIARLDLFSQFETSDAEYTLDVTDDFAITKFIFSWWDESANQGEGDWVEFISETSNKNAWYQNVLEQPVTTKKIRLEIPEKVADGYARLIEIQAWGIEDDDTGSDDATPSPVPTPTAVPTRRPTATPTVAPTPRTVELDLEKITVDGDSKKPTLNEDGSVTGTDCGRLLIPLDREYAEGDKLQFTVEGIADQPVRAWLENTTNENGRASLIIDPMTFSTVFTLTVGEDGTKASAKYLTLKKKNSDFTSITISKVTLTDLTERPPAVELDLSGTQAYGGTNPTATCNPDGSVTGTNCERLVIPLDREYAEGDQLQFTVYGEADQIVRAWLENTTNEQGQASRIVDPMEFKSTFTLTVGQDASGSPTKASAAQYLTLKKKSNAFTEIKITKVELTDLTERPAPPPVIELDLSGTKTLGSGASKTFDEADGSVTGTNCDGLVIPLLKTYSEGTTLQFTVYGEADAGVRAWLENTDSDNGQASGSQDPMKFKSTFTLTVGQGGKQGITSAKYLELKKSSYSAPAFTSITITKVEFSDLSETTSEPGWVTTWGTAEEKVDLSGPTDSAIPKLTNNGTINLNNHTVRQIIKVTTSGTKIRFRLSNEYGASDVEIGAMSIAKQGATAASSTIVDDTKKDITVDGQKEFSIPAGKVITTDPVDFNVDALDNVAVSMYIESAPTEKITGHRGARATTYWVEDNKVTETDFDSLSPVTTTSWFFLSDCSLYSEEQDNKAVVCFGDSITDGYGTDNGNGAKPDSYTRWGDYFARRLQANEKTKNVAVINEGIGSNSMLGSWPTDAGKDRFSRDLLDHDGVAYCILLFGINDLNGKGSNFVGDNKKYETPDDLYNALITEYRRIVNLCHAQGIKIYAAPILPFGKNDYYTEDSDYVRQKINTWLCIETDGIIDFAGAVTDPDNPICLLEKYSEDGLHPCIGGGYEAMANAIDLAMFED